jgi:DNA-binding MarR family transcriptional regulator
MKEAQKLAELTPKIMNAFHDFGRHHPSGAKLSMRQYQTLIILKASGSLTLSQLCKKLNLAPSTGTELVNRMITAGYIQKEHEQPDQRQVLLSVSPKGLELMEERKQETIDMFSEFLSKLPSDEDRKNFVSCFEHIWDLLQKYQPENTE